MSSNTPSSAAPSAPAAPAATAAASTDFRPFTASRPFAARAALALRRSRRVGLISTALRRSQTVIGVVSQAIAQLSLAHTLDTAVERIAELTASGHVAVYLREGRRLTAAASRGLEGPHADLAERLLELALGPFRGRGYLFIEDMRRDPRLEGLEEGWTVNGIRRALVVPLIVHDEVIGALAVYKTRARPYREGEESLLLALSSQLAVAVENARLHERAKELGEVLESTLESERRSARQLRGLYEISASFAESLSLDATLDAVARAMVELFGVDAAVIRMPDARGEPVAQAVVINMLDMRVLKPLPTFLSYFVAKSGLYAFTRAAAQGLGPHVRVAGIGPGPTLAASNQGEEHFFRQRAACILGRGSDPEDIVGAMRFILANKAFTGQMVAIDGGQHLSWKGAAAGWAGEG